MRAARGADLTVMRLLVEKGGDPKLNMNDKTNALMIAAGIGYREGRTRGTDSEAIEAIRLCMELGIDLNAISDKGETAMHGAAHRGGDEIVQFLFEKGARLDVKDKQGFTPLDRALGKGAVAGGGTRNPHASTVTLIEKLMKGPGTQTAAQVQQLPAALRLERHPVLDGFDLLAGDAIYHQKVAPLAKIPMGSSESYDGFRFFRGEVETRLYILGGRGVDVDLGGIFLLPEVLGKIGHDPFEFVRGPFGSVLGHPDDGTSPVRLALVFAGDLLRTMTNVTGLEQDVLAGPVREVGSSRG